MVEVLDDRREGALGARKGGGGVVAGISPVAQAP